LAIPLAIVIVWWLYFFKSRQEEWSVRLKAILSSLRFIALLIIAILLLKPFIIQIIEEEEKPRLLIYSDQSASVSQVEKDQVAEFILKAQSDLSEKYEVEGLSFASAVNTSPDSAALDPLYTDLGEVMNSVNDDFYGENIGAVVVASDGIQNKGSDPRYVSLKSGANVFTIALGDTSIRSDIELSQVLSNRLAFLNNDIEIKCRVLASKLKGKSSIVRLIKDGKELETKTLSIDQNDFSLEYSFVTQANKIGLNKYSISIDVLESEVNKLNNSSDLYVEVLDNRTRVKILAHAPHPDIAAMKRAIEQSDQYEVEVTLLSDWDEKIKTADLYIFHGLPADGNDLNKIKPILKEGIQTLSIVTTAVSIRHFNQLELGFTIEAARNKSDEVNGSINDQFNLFNLEKNNDLRRFPPLIAPFGNYIFNASHQIALFQKVGNIQTENPLLLFTEQDGLKNGALLAEGWWRWRMFEASISNDHWVDMVFQKAVQFLAITQKRTRINVAAPRQLQEREEVTFNAEYYNESFELNNDPQMELSVTDSLGNTIDYRFKNNANAYRTSLGALPPGSYDWKATVSVNADLFEEKGTFTVKENRSEFVNLVANHSLLADLSDKKGGSMFQLSESNVLLQNLASLEGAKPIVRSSKLWTSVIEWKLILFIIVILLAIEWFIRKYTGYV
jgi:hypothetical protein